jgi:hypothetical protein
MSILYKKLVVDVNKKKTIDNEFDNPIYRTTTSPGVKDEDELINED